MIEEGRLVRVWGIDRDVTERKNAELELERYRNRLEELVRERTEELEQVHEELVKKERLATLGQLIASVSHEMRNPLGTIRGSFYTVKEAVLDSQPALQKPIDRIERNISRCDRIIEELLDFTRAGNLTMEATDLDAFMREVFEEYSFPEQVERVLGFASDVTLRLDRERFRRCLINIISNACDAMVKTDKQVEEYRLTATSRLTPDRILVEIQDTGEGIPPETLARIAEPLFSTKGFGIGLGTSISSQIMESHDGGIEYESEPGKGTLVRLWFPSGAAQS